MDINDIFPKGLDYDDALDLLQPVAVYVLGMAVYAFFVFKFYRFMASRDMFELDLSKYAESRFRWVRAFLHAILYIGKYIILFPVFAFFWFAFLTVTLTFLSKGQSFSDILLMALVTVSTIRVTAYYDEDLSRDLSKILPFAVLAIFLIDASFFTIAESLEVLKKVRDYSENIFYYLVFLIAVEFALRLLMGFAKLLGGGKDRTPKEAAPAAEVDPSSPAEEPPSQEDNAEAMQER